MTWEACAHLAEGGVASEPASLLSDLAAAPAEIGLGERLPVDPVDESVRDKHRTMD